MNAGESAELQNFCRAERDSCVTKFRDNCRRALGHEFAVRSRVTEGQGANVLYSSWGC